MTEEQSLYRLNIDYSSPITRSAWDILNQAESEVVAVSKAQERAAYGNYYEPEEPGEYLWWMLDEAHAQEASGNTEYEHREREGYNDYGEICTLAYQEAAILRRYAINLMELSIPSIPPTKREENPNDDVASTFP